MRVGKKWLEHLLRLGALGLLLPSNAQASAGKASISVLPTTVAAPADEHCGEPSAAGEPELLDAAERIDSALMEAARDLELSPKTFKKPARRPFACRSLPEPNGKAWVLLPELAAQGDELELTLSAIPPGSKIALVRSQVVDPDELELRATVMLRDLVRAAESKTLSAPANPEDSEKIQSEEQLPESNSPGRAPLALNGGMLGGYVGWTLQRTSGSTDARLTYPLIALGAGVGLGASMVAADEWDISVGDAWHLSAGIWWPLSSAILLSDAYEVTPTEDRFAFGLLGATGGLTLATTSLVFSDVGEGGALISHSGAAFGTMLGGLSQLIRRGSTAEFPSKGAGMGAGIGVVAGGLLATQVNVEPSRVLFIDLSASLGALIGAAAGSPFLLVDEEEEIWRTRTWLAAVGGGMLGGATIGYFVTAGESPSMEGGAQTAQAWPLLGPIALAPLPGHDAALAWGTGVQGVW